MQNQQVTTPIPTPNWQAHVTVATIVKKDSKYLVVEEYANGGKLVINQPAGHVEADETLVEAAQRETLEETGWTVEVTHFLGIYTYQPSPEKTYYRYCFIAQPVSHDANLPLDDGIIAANWYNLDELASKPNLRSPLVLRCVQDAAAGNRYSLDIIQEFLLKS